MNDNTPYKNEGETVYATDPVETQQQQTKIPETDPYKDKEWLSYQYNVLGKTQKQIANEIGCGRRTIGDWLDKHGIEKKSRSEAICKGLGGEPYREKSWLKEQYIEREKSGSEIAEMCDTQAKTIWNWLDKHNIDKRKNAGEEVEYPRINKRDWLKEKYHNEGLLPIEIAELVGCSRHTVHDKLSEFNIERRSREETVTKQFKKGRVSKEFEADTVEETAGEAENISINRSKTKFKGQPLDFTMTHLGEGDDEVALYKNREWLKEKYVDENLSTREIGEICGSKETIRRWLMRFNIGRYGNGN